MGKEEMEMEMEMDGNYTPEEREFIRNFHAEYEAAEEPVADEDKLAPYGHDYKMFAGEGSMNIEWNAAMGMVDSWDLPPIEDFDPMVTCVVVVFIVAVCCCCRDYRFRRRRVVAVCAGCTAAVRPFV